MRTARPWRVRRQPRERRSCALDRQLDDERAARPGLRFHSQRAVRIEYEASHDRQAEARPAGFGRAEVVEGAIQLLFGHALAGVRDDHTDAGLSARPRRYGDASRSRRQTVDGVPDEVVEDAAQDEGVGPDGGQTLHELQAQVRVSGAAHAADGLAHHGVHVARLAGGLRVQAGVVTREVLEIGDARLDRRLAIPERGGESVRALAGGLTEMPEYVADGDQAVLDVVIHLAGEVAHRQPALSLAQARGPGAQPLGHGSEQATERTDLVGPVAVEGHVQSV